jgi:uncharacterized phage-associated protein
LWGAPFIEILGALLKTKPMPKEEKMNTEIQLNEDRAKELFLLLTAFSETDEYFGTTKLNKLLFFADFEAYLKYGKSITGHKYEAYPEGPMIKDFYKIRDEMTASGEIIIRELDFRGYTQHRPLALKPPSAKKFSGEEMNIIMQVITEYRGLSASQISARSHEFLGWKAVDIGEEIPYEIALVSTSDLTEEEWAFPGNIEIDFKKDGVDPMGIITHDAQNL